MGSKRARSRAAAPGQRGLFDDLPDESASQSDRFLLTLAPDLSALEDALIDQLGPWCGDLDAVTVLAPTALSRRRLTALIAPRTGGAVGVRLLGLETLAEHLCLHARGLPGRRLISRPQQLLILKNQVLAHLPEANVFRCLEDFRGGAASVLGSIQGRLRAGWTPERLREYAAGRALPQERSRLLSLAEVWERYQAGISEHFYSEDDLIAAGTEAVRTGEAPARLCIYGYYSFTHLQREFLRALCGAAETVRGFMVVPEDGRSRAAVYVERRGLTFYQSAGFRVQHAAASDAPPDLQQLRRHLFCDSAPPAVPKDSEAAVTILSVAGPHQEAVEVLRAATGASAGGGVGVLARSQSEWAPLFEDIAERAEMPVCIGAVKTFDGTRAGRFLLLLLQFVQRGLQRADLIELLNVAQHRTGPLADVSLVEVDRATRQLGIVHGLDNWRRELEGARRAAAGEAEPEDEEEIVHGQRARSIATEELIRVRPWIERILSAAERLSDGFGDWPALAEMLVELLDGFRLRSTGGSGEVYRIVGRLAMLEGLVPVPEDLDELAWFLRLTLTDEPEASGDYSPEGITSAGLMESRFAAWETVVVPGLCEKSLPSAAALQPAMMDVEQERGRGAGDGYVSLADDRLDQERYLFYLAVASARSRLVLTFPRMEESGSVRLPSQFLLEACRVLGGRRYSAEALEMPAAGAEEKVEPLTRWFERLPLTRFGPGDPLDCIDLWEFDILTTRALSLSGGSVAARGAVRQYLTEIRPAMDRAFTAGLRRWQAGGFNAWCGRIESEEALQALGEQWNPLRSTPAPTWIEQYARCPQEYFFAHVLGLTDLEEPTLDLTVEPQQFGAIVHRMLCDLYRGWAARRDLDFGSMGDEDIPELIKDAAAWLDANRCGSALGWALLRYRALQCVRQLLKWERENAGYRPYLFEMAFGRDGAAEANAPAELALPEGRVLRFRGVIDRVDRGPDCVRIIDYKTGKPRRAQTYRLKDNDLKLQLHVYVIAAAAMTQLSTADAGYLYLRIPPVTTRLDMGRFEEELEVLRQVLSRLLEIMLRGYFPPLQGTQSGGRHSACTYCAYRAACGPALADLMAQKERGMTEDSEDYAALTFLRAPVTSVTDSQ